MFRTIFTAVLAAQCAFGANLTCKLLAGDKAWPAKSEWEKALPGVTEIPKDPEGPKRPDFQLLVTKIEQVQAAVKFTAQHNLRLALVTSGLDFLARSDAPSGLSLQLGNLKGIRVSTSYTATAKGVPNVDYSKDPLKTANVIKPAKGSQPVVTFGVGCSGQEVNTALAKSGLFIMGPMTGGVTIAGGYTQNGGHAPFSNTYGLAADNVVEYKVVTADGKLRVANAVSEPELFWALRGGGGGTFGVVIEATVKAYPSPKITMTQWYLKTTKPDDMKSIYAPSAYVLSQLPSLSKNQGVQGYFFIYPNETRFSVFTIDQHSGIEKNNKTWMPILEKLGKYPGVQKPIYLHIDFPNFRNMFDTFFGSIEETPAKRRRDLLFEHDFGYSHVKRQEQFLNEAVPRGIIPLDSRLLSEAHLTSPKLEQALHDAMPKLELGMLRGHLTAGNKVLEMPVNATSVNPAWRKAWIHLIGTGWGTPDSSALKVLAPDSGCYANECLPQEIDYRKTMFGSHYDKLLSIKKKYDPTSLFWVSPGIGADEFTVDPKTLRVCPVSAQTPAIATEVSKGRPPISDSRFMGPHEQEVYDLGPETQAAANAKMDAAAKALAAAMAKAKEPAQSSKALGKSAKTPTAKGSKMGESKGAKSPSAREVLAARK